MIKCGAELLRTEGRDALSGQRGCRAATSELGPVRHVRCVMTSVSVMTAFQKKKKKKKKRWKKKKTFFARTCDLRVAVDLKICFVNKYRGIELVVPVQKAPHLSSIPMASHESRTYPPALRRKSFATGSARQTVIRDTPSPVRSSISLRSLAVDTLPPVATEPSTKSRIV